MKKTYLLASLAAGLACLFSATGFTSPAMAAETAEKQVKWHSIVNGHTGRRIMISTKHTLPEYTAALELQKAMRSMVLYGDGNCEIICSDEMPKGGAVVIGTVDSPLIKGIAKDIKLKAGEDDTIAQYLIGDNLILAGCSPRAALYSVLDFIHNKCQLYYLAPGDENAIVSKTDVSLPDGYARNFTPTFRYRAISHNNTEEGILFNVRNGLQEKDFRYGGSRIAGGEAIGPRRDDYKTHPEWFAMRNGERYLPDGWMINGCWSNKEFTETCLQRVAEQVESQKMDHIELTPADNPALCECPACQAMLKPDVTTGWFRYQNELVKYMKKRFPDLHYYALAYQEYREVPQVKVDAEFVEYCNYVRCFVHKKDDPTCASNRADFDRLEAWIRSGKANAMGLWDYTFDVFSSDYSLPVYDYLADLIYYCRDNRFVQIFLEGAVEESRPARWVAAQLLWDASQDAEKLLDEYCQAAYGPAAKEMAEFHRATAGAWTSQKAHLSQCFNNPAGSSRTYLSPELIALSKEKFAASEKKLQEQIAKVEPKVMAARAKKGRDTHAERALQNLTRQLNYVKYEEQVFSKWIALYEKMMKNILQLSIYQGYSDDDYAASAITFDNFKPGKERYPNKTTAQFYYTQDALLIRAICEDPKFKAKTFNLTHDGKDIWTNDTLELFLQPTGASTYYHFAVNPSGSYYEGDGMNGKWDAPWTVIGKNEDGKFTITMKIPFKSLNYELKPNDVWKIMLIRNASPVSVGMPNASHHDIGAAADVQFVNGKRP